MRQILLVGFISCFFCCELQAQSIDNDSLHKRKFFAQQEQVLPNRTKIDYSVPPQNISIAYQLPKGRPLSFKSNANPLQMQVQLGIGTRQQFFTEIQSTYTKGEHRFHGLLNVNNANAGNFQQHQFILGRVGVVSTSTRNTRHINFLIENRMQNRYGLSDVAARLDTVPYTMTAKLFATKLNATWQKNSDEKAGFNKAFTMQYATKDNVATCSSVLADIAYSSTLKNNSKWLVAAKGQYASLRFAPASGSMNYFLPTVQWQKKTDVMQLELGAAYLFANNYQRLLPAASLLLKTGNSGKNLIHFFAKGIVEQANVVDYFATMPFLQYEKMQWRIGSTNQYGVQYNVSGSKNLSASFGGSYLAYGNKLLYANYTDSAKWNVVKANYVNANAVQENVQVEYLWNLKTKINAKLTLQQFVNNRVSQLPTTMLDVYAQAQFSSKTCGFAGLQFARGLLGADAVNYFQVINPTVDVHAAILYQLANHWQLKGQVNNLLNSKNPIIGGYKAYGINALASIAYSFGQ